MRSASFSTPGGSAWVANDARAPRIVCELGHIANAVLELHPWYNSVTSQWPLGRRRGYTAGDGAAVSKVALSDVTLSGNHAQGGAGALAATLPLGDDRKRNAKASPERSGTRPTPR